MFNKLKILQIVLLVILTFPGSKSFAESVEIKQAYQVILRAITITDEIPVIVQDKRENLPAFRNLLALANNQVASVNDPVMYLILNKNLSFVKSYKDFKGVLPANFFILSATQGSTSIIKSLPGSPDIQIKHPQFYNDNSYWFLLLAQIKDRYNFFPDLTTKHYLGNLKSEGFFKDDLYTVINADQGFKFEDLSLPVQNRVPLAASSDIEYVLKNFSGRLNEKINFKAHIHRMRTIFGKNLLLYLDSLS